VGYSHISPFLFTRTLLPVMEKTALEPGSDVRIVNVRATLGSIRAALIDRTQVSSVAHRWVPNPRYDSLEAFNNDFTSTWRPKLNVYCKSLFTLTGKLLTGITHAAYTKLANVLWTKELQRRFDAGKIPITAVAIHPGNVMSGGLSPFVHKKGCA